MRGCRLIGWAIIVPQGCSGCSDCFRHSCVAGPAARWSGRVKAVDVLRKASPGRAGEHHGPARAVVREEMRPACLRWLGKLPSRAGRKRSRGVPGRSSKTLLRHPSGGAVRRTARRREAVPRPAPPRLRQRRLPGTTTARRATASSRAPRSADHRRTSAASGDCLAHFSQTSGQTSPRTGVLIPSSALPVVLAQPRLRAVEKATPDRLPLPPRLPSQFINAHQHLVVLVGRVLRLVLAPRLLPQPRQ